MSKKDNFIQFKYSKLDKKKMQNKIQLDNYKKLMAYINEHFKEEINIQRIEEICHYSHRNINRK